MRTWATHCAGLVVAAGLISEAFGQAPAVPAAPAAPAPAAAAGQAAGAAGAVQPHRLKAFFAGCKERFCASQLGSLVTNSMAPISALTGGILGSCCPTGP